MLDLFMKFVDKTINGILISFFKDTRHSYLHTFSAFKLLIGKRILRADYIEYTSKRYSQNVRAYLNVGYIPSDWNELKRKLPHKKIAKCWTI